MLRRLFAGLVTTAFCAISTTALPSPTGDSGELLRVMLQGESSARLAELVRLRGGEVTHELHIIQAVGAMLTRAQLDTILESPLVSRYIDDLSLTPPEPEREACDVGGALEIDSAGRDLRWRLYNKGTSPVALEELRLKWPAGLGDLLGASLDGQTFRAGKPLPPPAQALTIRAQGKAGSSPIGSPSVLTLTFEHAPDEKSPLEQRDISLQATFTGGCLTELIPGYDAYGEDTYYPAVAGAAALHQHGITGKGVTVAVLDSGLWELDSLRLDTAGRDRVVGRYDAIADRSATEVFDESGHGTHMTSVLAHSEKVLREGVPTGSFKGIAPDANIVAVKAFNKTGQGDFLDIVRGIQWIVDHREALDVRVLNLSFAARPRWPYWLDPINQAVMRAWQAGITVVAAAGNEGPDPMTVGSPGNLPYIITVGAVTDSWTPQDRNDDYIPDFSSQGPTPSAHIKPDLVAPGGHIGGVTRPGSTLTLEHPDYLLHSGEFVMTGTSQASALVSGIAALLLQLEPDLSPDDVKCKLISSAELAINRDGRLAYTPFQQGNGYVNAARAVTLGQRGCGNPDMDLSLDIAGDQHYEGPAVIDDQGNATLPGLDELYAGSQPAKGHSDDRRWGVKAHIERGTDTGPPVESPIDWLEVYLGEKAAMENLARQQQPPPNSNSPASKDLY